MWPSSTSYTPSSVHRSATASASPPSTSGPYDAIRRVIANSSSTLLRRSSSVAKRLSVPSSGICSPRRSGRPGWGGGSSSVVEGVGVDLQGVLVDDPQLAADRGLAHRVPQGGAACECACVGA